MKTYYTLYTLDVWGNEKDGYEINDSFNQGTIALPEKGSEADLLQAIDDKIGLSHRELAEIEGLNQDFIEVRDKTNGIPVFHLYWIEEPEFTYTVDLYERGDFQAHVDSPIGETVFELSAEGTELSLIEDGYMKHIEDVSGLEKYLIQMGIMPKGATLKKE